MTAPWGQTGPGAFQYKEDHLSENSTEVATTNATESRLASYGLFDPDLDFKNLVAEVQPGFYTRGFRLIEKDDLIGVPHVIVGLTYREGYLNPETKQYGDYVSVEAVVASTDVLESVPVKYQLPKELKVFGNETVIYNDGSTGIRRSLTELLHQTGIIDVGASKGDENLFDKPYQRWASGSEKATDGIVADAQGNKFRYAALRGLRLSEYENEYGPGRTFYFG